MMEQFDFSPSFQVGVQSYRPYVCVSTVVHVPHLCSPASVSVASQSELEQRCWGLRLPFSCLRVFLRVPRNFATLWCTVPLSCFQNLIFSTLTMSFEVYGDRQCLFLGVAAR